MTTTTTATFCKHGRPVGHCLACYGLVPRPVPRPVKS
jgi:hypothetical protein